MKDILVAVRVEVIFCCFLVHFLSQIIVIFYVFMENLKAMVFRKLRNLVSRQAQAAAFKETTNAQLSSAT